METSDTISAIIGVLLFWLAYQWGWQRALLDRFRQRLFSLRDAMFMDAAEGKLSFDDDVYGMLRTMMNAVISSSGRLSVVHLIVVIAARRWVDSLGYAERPLTIDKKVAKTIATMKEGETQAQKAELYEEYFQKLHFECAYYMLCWTPILGLIAAATLVLLPIAVMTRCVRSVVTFRLPGDFIGGSVNLAREMRLTA